MFRTQVSLEEERGEAERHRVGAIYRRRGWVLRGEIFSPTCLSAARELVPAIYGGSAQCACERVRHGGASALSTAARSWQFAAVGWRVSERGKGKRERGEAPVGPGSFARANSWLSGAATSSRQWR